MGLKHKSTFLILCGDVCLPKTDEVSNGTQCTLLPNRIDLEPKITYFIEYMIKI